MTSPAIAGRVPTARIERFRRTRTRSAWKPGVVVLLGGFTGLSRELGGKRRSESRVSRSAIPGTDSCSRAGSSTSSYCPACAALSDCKALAPVRDTGTPDSLSIPPRSPPRPALREETRQPGNSLPAPYRPSRRRKGKRSPPSCRTPGRRSLPWCGSASHTRRRMRSRASGLEPRHPMGTSARRRRVQRSPTRLRSEAVSPSTRSTSPRRGSRHSSSGARPCRPWRHCSRRRAATQQRPPLPASADRRTCTWDSIRPSDSALRRRTASNWRRSPLSGRRRRRGRGCGGVETRDWDSATLS